MQYYNAPEEIEFRGFGEVTVENNYSITKHAFHQDDILKGIENHTEVWDKNGNLYSTSVKEYSTQELYSDVNLILLENESSTQFDSLTQSLNDSIGWSSYKEYDEYDDYGNPLSVTEYGDVDVTGDERYLHYEYVNDEDDWILGKTVHEWIEDSDYLNCSESWYYYDDTEDNSDLNRGLLTKVVSWNNNGDDPSVLYDYDNYGNIVEITDAKGSSQTIEYDDKHVYPVSIENSLGQNEFYEYNDLGRITKITDSNGVSTDYVYDDLHRISKVIKPYDNSSSPSIEYAYYQRYGGLNDMQKYTLAPSIICTNVKADDFYHGMSNESFLDYFFDCVKYVVIFSSGDGTLTDYQMVFNVDYEQEMQSDFDDIRFADENGDLLPYWIEAKNDSISAKVWVKVPEIDEINGTTVKMYYGNPGISSGENGDDVFDFFDDFDGSSIDASKWKTASKSGSSPTISISDNVVSVTKDDVDWGYLYSNYKINDPIVIEGRVKLTAESGKWTAAGLVDADSEHYEYAVFQGNEDNKIVYLSDGEGRASQSSVDFTSGDYTRIKVIWTGTNTAFYENDEYQATLTVGNPSAAAESSIGMCADRATAYADYMFIHQYAENEPTYQVFEYNPEYDLSVFTNLKDIIISPSGDGTLTDYQMVFNVGYEQEMQSDFDDIRFTDENGDLLPYWIEAKNDSISAKVWVKVPEIDVINGATIKMYYGNPEIPSGENGGAVFDFFDDFDGSSIDTSKWQTESKSGSSPTISVSDSVVLVTKEDVDWGYLYSNYKINDPIVIEGRVKLTAESGKWTAAGLVDADSEHYEYAVFQGDEDDKIVYLSEGDGQASKSSVDFTSGDYTRIKVIWTGTNTTFYENGEYKAILTVGNPAAYESSIGICADRATAYADYMFIHQYVENEPTYSYIPIDIDKENTTENFTDFMSIDVYDGFGQVIQTKYEGEDDWIRQSTTYNELGLVCSTEVPHYINESGQSVIYQYDPIGRPTVITNTDNTTLNYHYELENTTITNQNGVNKTLTSDIYGNIAKVYEFNENETYITGYEYDALNNLINITPGLNQPTTLPSVYFTYDSLGRKIAMNDPDMGNWTYEYDLNGNLINQTDARGISTLLSYDALDRLTAIDYPNDEDVSFTYDLEYNGTLSRVTKGAISSIYDYDDRYRVEGETIGYVPGTSGYTTSYEYDSMDRPTTITYPDGNSVNLTYNAQTLLESVEGVVDNLDYNARNQITTKELSNGVVTSYTYDAEKLLLDRIYTESLQDLNYDFDNVGNILEIEDNVLNSVKTYGYDDLDRLTSADMSVNSVSTYQRDFTYDRYGCIQQVDENSITISSYEYNLTPFHAPDTYNGNILDYDANGNLVEDEDFIYTYNDANQLSEVRYSGNNSLVEKYWYDANGQRVKKQNSAGEFSYYINQFYEIENGTATSYFFRDDERIAKETSGDMEWYLSDHLGSTTLLINESGLEVERTEYYPYGEVQSGGLEKYGFTGQENDADTELMYYGARYYSPEYRVFVQPDTMLPDLYNPQALNRYSYTLNNPVKYNDPTGHYIESGIDIAFLAMDLNDIRTGNADKWTYVGLAADVACLALPGATGGRLAVKALEEGVTHGDDILAAGKAVNKGIGVGNTASTVAKYGDDTGEALAKMSSEVESMGIVGKNAGATGTLKHTEFSKMAKEWANGRSGATVYIEKSIDVSGDLIDARSKGTLRPDVMEIGQDGIVRVYDLKTGGATLKNNWMNNVQQRLMSTKKYQGVEFYQVKNGETTRVR
jgi:RHS repeat-associated protein